jgi:hypothetical protein
MYIPDSFASRLKDEFPNLRIRFSEKRQAFQIEQQIGRGCLPPIHIDPHNDDLIRAKDGYWKVCEVRPGTTMPCEQCGSTLQVPPLKFKEVTCAKCVRDGFDGRVVAGYFPLSEILLEHLRFLNPLTGGIERNAEMVDRHNKQLLASRERDVQNTVESTKDDYGFIAGIPSVGYTGNTKIIHRDRI